MTVNKIVYEDARGIRMPMIVGASIEWTVEQAQMHLDDHGHGTVLSCSADNPDFDVCMRELAARAALNACQFCAG
jgi:hypothetical protein